jgi:hypothetical protein
LLLLLCPLAAKKKKRLRLLLQHLWPLLRQLLTHLLLLQLPTPLLRLLLRQPHLLPSNGKKLSRHGSGML